MHDNSLTRYRYLIRLFAGAMRIGLAAVLIGPSLYSQQMQTVKSREHVKVLVVRVYPEAFAPRSATISDRKIMLVVENGDALKGHEFSFRRLAGGQGELRRQQTAARSRRWLTVLDLTPGQYVLEERGPGNRTFTLTVE
jgi:hypothetical protein